MQAEIIAVGTELLLGQIVDTNTAYLAQQLADLGIDVYHQSTVGDNYERLKSTLQSSLQRADLIITTGGLGPTDDDLTREVIADAVGVELVKDDKLAADIASYFEAADRKMAANNLTQAYLPAGAEPINNQRGTAPGIILEAQDSIIIALPGVPPEMKAMTEEEVIPYLTNQIAREELIKSKVLKVVGYGESDLEIEIKDILNNQTNPTLALLAGRGEVKLRLTVKAESESKADDLLAQLEAKLRSRLGESIFGIDSETMAEVVGKKLRNSGLTLATAESCTGGLIGDRITNVSGSSDYFECGVVTYSNQSKEELINVQAQTLQQFGAVSAQTAEEMAIGVRELAGTDVGMAVTGIAGPTGGSKEKPVGLVYLGLAVGEEVRSYQFNLHGSRQQIKHLTSQYALDKLRRYLINHCSN
ncbi:MAG: competence/damage-inducible protein A [Bacillota bacterium]